jgi:uncharacterized protein (TIGR04255 family)
MTSTASSSSPLPSYRNPPVIEVSFGLIFQKLVGMQSRHFGQFWSEHTREYPKTTDASPLLDASDVESQRLIVLDLPPIRRMMLYSENDQYVAQLQDTRLHVNWRRTKPEDQYPRYQEVLSKFDHLWSEFAKFVERENVGPLSILRYELSYFNHIEMGKDVARSIEENIKFFQFSPLRDSYPSTPDSVNAAWRFGMPGQRGTATASLSNAIDKISGNNLLVLIFTCTGPHSEKYSPREWFDAAHEWIVRSFTDLTTIEAHKKWGREK